MTTAPKCFSDELRDLSTKFQDRPACLGELLAATQGRGFGLLLLLISLPFITPIPLPGFSTPFGLVVVLIGARLAIGRRPWLPTRMLRRPLPPRFVSRVLLRASSTMRWLEAVARPRLDFLHEQWIYRRIAGGLITVSGLLLLLPLPVPFTNTLPALTVVLLSAGAVERDGLLFIAGCVMFVVAAGYFVLLAFGGIHVFDWIWG